MRALGPSRTGIRPIVPRSSAVNTATTPGKASAALVRIDPRRAWGYGERTTVACSRPGNRKSAAYLPRPVRSRGSSFRRTERPIDVGGSAAAPPTPPPPGGVDVDPTGSEPRDVG